MCYLIILNRQQQARPHRWGSELLLLPGHHEGVQWNQRSLLLHHVQDASGFRQVRPTFKRPPSLLRPFLIVENADGTLSLWLLQMVSRAARRASCRPGLVQTGARWAGEDQRRQPRVRQRRQTERRGSSHGLHRAGDQDQDDVTRESGHVHPQPAVRLWPSVHKPSKSDEIFMGDTDHFPIEL